METKVCSKCLVEKPLSEYYKDKRRMYGITSQCKQCMYITSRKYVINNKEKINKIKKLWAELNSDKIKKARLDWEKKHPDNLKAKAQKYRKKNPDKVKKWRTDWINRKPENKTKVKNYLKLYSKDYGKKNNEKIKALCTYQRDELYYCYINAKLKRQGFKKEDITPELIEVKRLLIKIKRLCKTSPNSETA